jgi:hypothetical protein
VNLTKPVTGAVFAHLSQFSSLATLADFLSRQVEENRMKRVLAVWYSQSGQLDRVMDRMLASLRQAPDVTLQEVKLQPASPYPFPWPFWRFLDSFPECVHRDPAPIQPLALATEAEFDLVIVGYPVWFLSPAAPVTAFLQSEQGQRLLCGKPVITVTACRNMWLMAQDAVKELLQQAGAKHCDHVALTDRGSALATFVTTPRWVLTGRREAFWGFPRAGVSDNDIAACDRFGHAVVSGLRAGADTAASPMLRGLRACVVDDRLIASERIGIRSFRIWGKLLRALGKPGAPLRRMALVFYVVFLLTLIVTVVPVTMLLKSTLRPLLRARLQAMKDHYELPSGSDAGRLNETV